MQIASAAAAASGGGTSGERLQPSRKERIKAGGHGGGAPVRRAGIGQFRKAAALSVRLREGFRTAKRYFTQYRGFRRKGLLRRSRRRTHPLKRDSAERRLFPYIQELIRVSPLPAVPNSDNTPYPQRWKPIIPRDGMASNGGVCICCICMCLQEVNGAFPLGGSKWRTRPYSQRRYQGFFVRRAYPSAPLLAFTRFAPGIFSAGGVG